MYQQKSKEAIANLEADTLGARLAKTALEKNISVAELSKRIGASRATIYHWFNGGNITRAYKGPVENLLQSL